MNNEAVRILLEVSKAVNKLQNEEIEESYINYVLFRFTGNSLLNELGPEKFAELVTEIKGENNE
jgi:hypothetical protein